MNRKQVTLPLIFEIGGSLATDKENYNTQRAMLIHTLLFNQSIVLPDSVAIRNRNFRKLISQDVQISHMLTKDNFSID